MIKLYDTLDAYVLPDSVATEPEAASVAFAVQKQIRRIIDHANAARIWCMIDTLPADLLDIAAIELRTPSYSQDFDVETKRALIKGTLEFYMLAGTVGAADRLIKTIFGRGEIKEWFQYGGEAHHFRIVGLPGSAAKTPISAIKETLDPVKRKSSWLDAVVTTTSLNTDVYMGGIFRRGVPLRGLAPGLSFAKFRKDYGRITRMWRYSRTNLSQGVETE